MEVEQPGLGVKVMLVEWAWRMRMMVSCDVSVSVNRRLAFEMLPLIQMMTTILGRRTGTSSRSRRCCSML